MSAYKLMPGHIFNPVLKSERNGPCPCTSGKKFKKCCYKYLPRAIDIEEYRRELEKRIKEIVK